MTTFFKNKKIKNYMSKAVDGALFALLVSLLVDGIYSVIIGETFEYFSLFFIFNLISWIFFSILSADKKTFFISVIIIAFFILIYILFFDFEMFFFSVYQQIVFLSNNFAGALLEADNIYHFVAVQLIALAVSLLIMPIYFFKSHSKLTAGFCILIVIVYFQASLFLYDIDFQYAFLAIMPVLLYIYGRARHYKRKKHNIEQKSYILTQARHIVLVLLPTALVAFGVMHLPTDLHSEQFFEYINLTAGKVVNSFETLQRISARFFSIDSQEEQLGGDLVQTGVVRFNLQNEHPIYLKTNSYGKYTGSSFINTSEEEIFEPFAPIDLARHEVYYDLSYQIEFVNYPGRILPMPDDVQGISGTEATSFSINQYDTVYSNQYFAEGIKLEIDYKYPSFSYIDFFYFADHSDYAISEPIPEQALGQLPESVTDRTIELALGFDDSIKKTITDIVGENAFSMDMLSPAQLYTYRAAVISEYLYENYTYTTTPGEQVGEDFVDSFLFEQQEGYCTSFASAMYVLLRASDTPCRYVTGYAVHEVSDSEAVEVTDYNSHAWIEVYLPGVGYMMVDATPPDYSSVLSGTQTPDIWEEPDREVGDRDQLDENLVDQEILDQMEEDFEQDLQEDDLQNEQSDNANAEQNNKLPTAVWIAIYATLACGAIALALLLKKRYISKVLSSKDIDIVYKNLINLLSLLGYKQRENETIRQFVRRFDRLNKPFGVAESKAETQDELCTDRSPNLDEKMERMLINIETHLYHRGKEQEDISELIAFRNRVNSFVVGSRSELMYLILFR